MAVMHQEVTDLYAAYNGDSCAVLPSLPEESIHFAIYSPPFADLYNYSSSVHDLSNARSYEEFLTHYEFIVREVSRVILPGRLTAVHCADIPVPGQQDGFRDFPGDIIRLHQKHGFKYHGRVCIWKEPFRVALRTRLNSLKHGMLVKDSAVSSVAAGDYLLLFRKRGENAVPVSHPEGLTTYAGEREIPAGLIHTAGEKRQEKNRLSQWIWRNYASCFWDDIRIDRVLPYRESREPDDEKHVCPLQLDVIERALTLWTNPGEKVLTPFMGVGSEVYGAVTNGRVGVGIELKTSYYKQALRNIRAGIEGRKVEGLFADDAELVADEA